MSQKVFITVKVCLDTCEPIQKETFQCKKYCLWISKKKRIKLKFVLSMDKFEEKNIIHLEKFRQNVQKFKLMVNYRGLLERIKSH